MKTPRQIFMLLFLAAITFTFTQCGSDDPASNKKSDFYVAGRYNNGTDNVPAYWKNGELVELSEEAGGADLIAVVGDDVYVVGYLDGSEKKRLWTNGVMTDFSGDGSNEHDYVYMMRVIGNDWYAVGMRSNSSGDHATYWKNGVIHIIDTDYDSRAYDIAVDGNDVYVVGFQRNINGHGYATYWKNDDDHDLTLNNVAGSEAYGIVIKNGDVYISGSLPGTLAAWKNDELLTLTNAEDTYTGGGSIAVVNNDVYIIGYHSVGGTSIAKYWKNGTPETLPTPESATSGYGYAIASNGDDIYFLGEAYIGTGYHTLIWKNFEILTPFDGTESLSGYGYGMMLAK